MFKTDQLTIIKRDHNSTLQMVLSVHHTVYLNSIMMTKPLVEYPLLLPTTTNLFLSVCQLFPIPTLSVCLSTVSVPKLSRAADQPPSSRWFASTTRLLCLCHVQDEAELPPIWPAMASAGVKLDRNTIQYHLSLDMPLLDSISGPGTASVCSPELSKALGQLIFQTVAEDIQSGLHIFSVCYPTQASRAKANQIAGLYDKKVRR